MRQARAPKLRCIPDKVEHAEVRFLHMYVVYELKEGKESLSLVRQDEPDERILSPEMKTIWGKVDRTKLSMPIFAPTPRYLGKTSEVQMEEQMIVSFNDRKTPEGWLALGAHFG